MHRYEATPAGWILTGTDDGIGGHHARPRPDEAPVARPALPGRRGLRRVGRRLPSAAPATTTTAAGGTTAAATPACADAAALKASVAELDQLDPPQAGKAGTVAALQEVRDDLTKLKASAGSEWGDQVTELDAAVNGFQATISGISGDSLLSDLPTIVSDLERIDTAWKALDEQITQTCG